MSSKAKENKASSSNASASRKGGSPFYTGNRIFADCINLSATGATEDIEKRLQKQDACETLVEVKTLVALIMTPNARAQKFQSDVEKRLEILI